MILPTFGASIGFRWHLGISNKHRENVGSTMPCVSIGRCLCKKDSKVAPTKSSFWSMELEGNFINRMIGLNGNQQFFISWEMLISLRWWKAVWACCGVLLGDSEFKLLVDGCDAHSIYLEDGFISGHAYHGDWRMTHAVQWVSSTSMRLNFVFQHLGYFCHEVRSSISMTDALAKQGVGKSLSLRGSCYVIDVVGWRIWCSYTVCQECCIVYEFFSLIIFFRYQLKK